MYEILKSAHSGWRYLVIILLLVAFISALMGYVGKKPYTEGNRKLNVFTLISSHIQLLLGLAIYFMHDWYKGDSSVAIQRYWKMEHISMMLIAIVLITVGNARSKRGTTALAKHKTIAIFFGLALLLIVGAIFAMVKVDPSRHFFGM
ncbi:cytochrome b561 [Pedobacter lusitanus]|uniref:Cytochrome b561 n=1 Tax=Pedobacter lusitanus TaxID=1503925 RepID=A0A0D0GJD8_9SPHI|nr:cytochrome b561 [Pedobacter lusitanus]